MEPEDFRAGDGCPSFKFPPEKQFEIDRALALKNLALGLTYENNALEKKDPYFLLDAYSFFKKAYKKWLFINREGYDKKPALLIEDYLSVTTALFKMYKISKTEEDKNKAEECFNQAKEMYSFHQEELSFLQQINLEVLVEKVKSLSEGLTAEVEPVNPSPCESMEFTQPLPPGDNFQLDGGEGESSTNHGSTQIIHPVTPLGSPLGTPLTDVTPSIPENSSLQVTPAVSRVNYGSCFASSSIGDALNRKGSFLKSYGENPEADQQLSGIKTVLFADTSEKDLKRKREEKDPVIPESPSKKTSESSLRKRNFGSGL